MVIEIIKAIIMGGLPVALFTFLIVQWSIASGRMEPFNDEDGLQKQFKAYAKVQKDAHKNDNKPSRNRHFGGDLFHKKIMSFGGGFYGTMAILTYLLIETLEIFSFLGKIFTPDSWSLNLSINLIIDFIINSVMNFVAAITWFMTLPDYLPVNMGWVWLIVAYAGYLAGLEITSQHGANLWEKLEAASNKLEAWLVLKVRTITQQQNAPGTSISNANTKDPGEKE